MPPFNVRRISIGFILWIFLPCLCTLPAFRSSAQALVPMSADTPADQPQAIYKLSHARIEQAFRQVKARRGSGSDALRLLETERTSRSARMRAEKEASLALAIALMHEAAAKIEEQRGNWKEAARHNSLAYQNDRLYRRDAAWKHLRDMGAELAKTERSRIALNVLRFAFEDAERLRIPLEAGRTAYVWGLAYALSGEHARALEALERASHRLAGKGTAQELSAVLDAQSVSLLATGRYAAALNASKAAIVKWGEAADIPAPLLEHLAEAYLKLNDPEKALKALQVARTAAGLMGETERKPFLISILNSTGQAQAALLDYSHAAFSFEAALAMPEVAQNPRMEATLRANHGTSLFNGGKFDLGVAEIRRSLVLRRATKDAYGEAICLHALAKMHSTPLPETPFDLDFSFR
jgi:tetratricopeptide (TPR) repeat protein